ncbi:hypothetical protein MRB53_023805 [Persea americana]|uniref:Uncharacterized protein n=1 Tax=Persea americana TaxID=3435 RepID=A0ACC2LBK5_PERAE|nr:hypothetical protein MRB53_023805 [Persea americana]
MASSSYPNWMQSREGDVGFEPARVSLETSATLKKSRTSGMTRERPKWLPNDWRMEVRIRTSGKTAGMKDRYYYDPKSHRRFRSKREVESFLQTGTIQRSTPKSRKYATDKHQQSATRFGFKNCSTKANWVLTSSVEGLWPPYSNDEELPESTWKSWAVAMEEIGNGTYKL